VSLLHFLRSSCAASVCGVAILLFSATAQAAEGGHPMGMQCTSCHLSSEPADVRMGGRLIANQDQLCGSCHRGAKEMSHPTGFRPTRSVNASLPLDGQGQLTCSTCHDVHGTSAGLLRGSARGRDFCAGCHDAGFFTAMKDRGESLTVSAHIDARRTFSRVGVDGYSARCLSCHGDSGEQHSGSRGLRHGGGRSNHPVGVSYTDALRHGTYRLPASLPRQVFLPDGKVGCVSCHEGYSREHGRLVMTLDKSRLCMSCHAL
jgi:predicted CXXCH cytochrome family protein